MARSLRVFVPNALHHIIMRGNHRLAVFKNAGDFERFLKLLWKYKNKYKSKIYSYCLMSNHFHLLIEPFDKLALSKMMHGINASYAMWFNAKYKKCGHLWQARYKNYIVQCDQYLLTLFSYIEHNPVRSNICTAAADYAWSSYNARILGENNKVLDFLSNDERRGQV